MTILVSKRSEQLKIFSCFNAVLIWISPALSCAEELQMNSHKYEIDSLLSELESVSEKDPEKFERIRSKIIKTAIESYPEETQQRYYGIQFTLDCELRKYKNPVARMNRMVEIFWAKVYEFNLALNHPEAIFAARENKREPAKVIQLYPRQKSSPPSSIVN
jgi:hypothetical protein